MGGKKEFDERKRKIYEFITDYILKTGVGPTYDIIMDGTKTASKKTVSDAVHSLSDEGAIETETVGNKTYIKAPERERAGTVRKVRLVTTAYCGTPFYSDENLSKTIMLPTNIFGTYDAFAVLARGDSMQGQGIYDEDIVIVYPNQQVSPGYTVCVEIPGEGMLIKILEEDKKGNVFFRSARYLDNGDQDPDYPDIYPDEEGGYRIYGLVGYVIHTIKKIRG